MKGYGVKRHVSKAAEKEGYKVTSTRRGRKVQKAVVRSVKKRARRIDKVEGGAD